MLDGGGADRRPMGVVWITKADHGGDERRRRPREGSSWQAVTTGGALDSRSRARP
jgi:hypothetical protein